MPGQLDLYGPSPTVVEAAAPSPTWTRLAHKVPPGIALGTSSWSFPGWRELVWRGEHTENVLAKDGLRAYAEHPLLTGVGVDRTFYAPVADDVLAAYAQMVPASFRFLVKAASALTWARFPDHPRYGDRAQAPNPEFLDVSYARDLVVYPFVQGLGDKGRTLLFQFPPQALHHLAGEPNAKLGAQELRQRLADRLHAFLSELPELGPGARYSVELRTPDAIGEPVDRALLDAGAVPCLTAIRGMPPVAEQAERWGIYRFDMLVARWMLTQDLSYEEARRKFSPFTHLQAPDPPTRDSIANLIERFVHASKPGIVIVNNKAEGSAPLSVLRLAERLARS